VTPSRQSDIRFYPGAGGLRGASPAQLNQSLFLSQYRELTSHFAHNKEAFRISAGEFAYDQLIFELLLFDLSSWHLFPLSRFYSPAIHRWSSIPAKGSIDPFYASNKEPDLFLCSGYDRPPSFIIGSRWSEFWNVLMVEMNHLNWRRSRCHHSEVEPQPSNKTLWSLNPKEQGGTGTVTIQALGYMGKSIKSALTLRIHS
jgi:hypothetical protein